MTSDKKNLVPKFIDTGSGIITPWDKIKLTRYIFIKNIYKLY